jgi:outer membrane protein
MMKKLLVLACLAATVSLSGGTAQADDIRGNLGVTGKMGFLVPSDNDSDFFHNRTDTGFVGGGGLIYGIDDHFAAEFDITRTSFGSETGDFGITNFTLGGQYRFLVPRRELVPFVGLGMDILVSDYDPHDGARRDVDSTVGFHVSGGVDYFLQRSLALTAEAKIVAAPDVAINDRYGDRRGTFDPSSFSTTVGVRYFFR